MNPTEPRLRAAIEAAMTQVNTTATAVADRVGEVLGTMATSSTRIADRDLMLSSQFELRKNRASFALVFKDELRKKVDQELEPRETSRRSLSSANWQSLSLVDDREVEERMVFDRIAQMISHECENELHELAAYTGSLLRIGRADEERNPLRSEILGAVLYRAIEAVSDEAATRKLLARELGQAFAKAMPACYAEIVRDWQERGVRPVGLAVRGVEGPGNQLDGVNTGYQALPKDEWHSTRSQFSEFDATASLERDAGPPSRRGSGSLRGGRGGSMTSTVPGGAGGYGGRGGFTSRSAAFDAQADAQLMHLLRRLTSLASRPGDIDAAPRRWGPTNVGGGTRGYGAATEFTPGTGASPPTAGATYDDGHPGLMAVNLIRAHREELMQASTGKLDHMVIDVVGSLFDQILSDSRVPPQMARQIARLQLPVLRVALNDSSFFSSRRHPVRRFVNRIASLACAFDDFDEGPGKQFIDRVRDLVQEIVDGDFDQIELYTAKLAELENFIAQQTQGEVQQTPAAATLEGKESELRIQQRYMLQLQAALGPMSLPQYLQDFVAQVWSQALVLAVRRDGSNSDRAQRFRRAGRDLVMSVQPKGSPASRKKFLMQLPPLMKDLNEGMKLIGWPEAAQKGFFAKLLPAHAESLKGQAMSDLDYNMMAKQLEGVFSLPVPGVESLSMADSVPEVESAVLERRFSPEEVERVGLVPESAVDWSGTPVDIDLGAEGDTEFDSQPSDSTSLGLGLDINLDLAPSDQPDPSRGPRLVDHIQLGFAYQMQLKDEWQKVRLTYMSPARSFFVFSRGKKHQETISMTSRMLARMCETGRMRAYENAYLMERATFRARKQLAALKATAKH
jgi:hypothetical protein